MDSGTLSGIMTALLLIIFIGIGIWAYSSKRKKDFDEAAKLPLEGNEQDSAGDKRDE